MDWITSTSPGLLYYLKYVNPLFSGRLDLFFFEVFALVGLVSAVWAVCIRKDNELSRAVVMTFAGMCVGFSCLLALGYLTPHSEASTEEYNDVLKLNEVILKVKESSLSTGEQKALDKACAYFDQLTPGAKLTKGQAAVLAGCLFSLEDAAIREENARRIGTMRDRLSDARGTCAKQDPS